MSDIGFLLLAYDLSYDEIAEALELIKDTKASKRDQEAAKIKLWDNYYNGGLIKKHLADARRSIERSKYDKINRDQYEDLKQDAQLLFFQAVDTFKLGNNFTTYLNLIMNRLKGEEAVKYMTSFKDDTFYYEVYRTVAIWLKNNVNRGEFKKRRPDLHDIFKGVMKSTNLREREFYDNMRGKRRKLTYRDFESALKQYGASTAQSLFAQHGIGGSESEPMTLGDMVSQHREKLPPEVYETRELRQTIKKEITKILSKDEASVITKYYDLDMKRRGKSLSYEQIAVENKWFYPNSSDGNTKKVERLLRSAIGKLKGSKKLLEFAASFKSSIVKTADKILNVQFFKTGELMNVKLTCDEEEVIKFATAQIGK